MPYPQQSSGGGIILFVIFIVILICLFVVFGDRFELTRNLHNKLFSGFDTLSQPVKYNERTIIQPPKSETDWCRIAEIQVDEDIEKPIRNRVMGWDPISEACVIEYTGHSCSLGKVVKVRYAYTGLIGGEIVWITTDGIYGNPKNYKDYINDLQKSHIENKPCIPNLYEGVTI